MQDYKLALIASQSQQKAALGDPKSTHCHTEPFTSPLVPTPHRATKRPTMTLCEMDTSKRQLGAGALRQQAHPAPVR